MKCCQSRPQQIHREREAVLTFCHASYPRELDQGGSRCLVMLISIGYVLRMERDDFVVDAESFEAIFQSTRSAWSATVRGRRVKPELAISIHALRMERDGTYAGCAVSYHDFNPRAPHGARQEKIAIIKKVILFQSTRSAWSATAAVMISILGTAPFQSTRSAWSATCTFGGIARLRADFNPRAPHGARRGGNDLEFRYGSISIHALRMERDASRVAADF